jgi:hypothetical protein
MQSGASGEAKIKWVFPLRVHAWARPPYVHLWHLADIGADPEACPLLGAKRTSPISRPPISLSRPPERVVSLRHYILPESCCEVRLLVR